LPAGWTIVYEQQTEPLSGGSASSGKGPASDLAALRQGVDLALGLSLLEAVLSYDLRNEIVPVQA
jgi:hypothetical protein